jgi:hypothetical protein
LLCVAETGAAAWLATGVATAGIAASASVALHSGSAGGRYEARSEDWFSQVNINESDELLKHYKKKPSAPTQNRFEVLH